MKKTMADAERAARARSVRDLPERLRDDADALLTAYGETLEREHSPETVAGEVRLLLTKLAFFEPDECPDLEDVLEGWPWETNWERRGDLTAARQGRCVGLDTVAQIADGKETGPRSSRVGKQKK